MRVAGLIAEHVMATMGGHPTNHRSFQSHRSGYGEGDLQASPGDKASMAEEPMKPDRDPEPGKEIENRGHHQIAQLDPMTPQEGERDHQSYEGGGDQCHRDDLLPYRYMRRIGITDWTRLVERDAFI
jgi:hypothetical protein